MPGAKALDHQALSIRSAARTLSVLEAFSRHGRGVSLGSIARETGLDKSAVQRCVATLASLGYLAQAQDRRFKPTSKCLELGYNFLMSHPLLPRAHALLLKLREETGERTNLSLYEGTTLIYAIRFHGPGEWELPMSLVGRRMPVYSTAGGRAMLSKLDDTEVRAILAASNLRPRTSRTHTSISEIMEQVRLARRNGYAVVQGESIVKEIALAAAVTDEEGRPVAAVHVTAKLAEWTVESFSRHFAANVTNTANNLSALGDG